MPSNIVKSFADKTGKSVKEVEDLWNQAKELAKEAGFSETKDSEQFYSYVTGILKKSLKIEEDASITTSSVGGQFANKLTKRPFTRYKKCVEESIKRANELL